MAAQHLRILQELSNRSVGRAFAHHLRDINLSCVKNVKYSFNPFYGKVQSIREVMFQLGVPKRRLTNPTCVLKSDVRSDKCEPEMTVLFSDGHKALFKTTNLTTIEIIKEFNKICKEHEIQQTGKKR